MKEFSRTKEGSWSTGAVSGDTSAFLLVPKSRYVMPQEVYDELQSRQRRPTPFAYPQPPKLRSMPADKRVPYLFDAWSTHYLRRAGRSSKTRSRLSAETLNAAAALLAREGIAPLIWYWWCWNQNNFKGKSKKGSYSPYPNITFCLQPRRIEGHLEMFFDQPDDSWKAPAPRIPAVVRCNQIVDAYTNAVAVHKPATVVQACMVLDDVLPKSEYNRLLDAACEDVAATQRRLERKVLEGGWIWG